MLCYEINRELKAGRRMVATVEGEEVEIVKARSGFKGQFQVKLTNGRWRYSSESSARILEEEIEEDERKVASA